MMSYEVSDINNQVIITNCKISILKELPFSNNKSIIINNIIFKKIYTFENNPRIQKILLKLNDDPYLYILKNNHHYFEVWIMPYKFNSKYNSKGYIFYPSIV